MLQSKQNHTKWLILLKFLASTKRKRQTLKTATILDAKDDKANIDAKINSLKHLSGMQQSKAML
jgi:hypothetical protein